MDGRERLRLYLEQRRELGESELMLDTLPVADVLALIGAAGARGTPGERTTSQKTPDARTGDTSAAPPQTPAAPGANAPLSKSTQPEPNQDAGRDRTRDAGSERPQDAAPSVVPPPAPTPRFDPAMTTRDWRAQLSAPRERQERPTTSREPTPPEAAELGVRTTPAWLTALDVPLGLSVGSGLSVPPGITSLGDVATTVAACRACPLGESARNPVPGEGHPEAQFVCVGEGPGQQEDESGRPFVGAAGQLLTKILAAIQFTREDVFICNVVKHRPPGNRTPNPDEVQACRPYLEQQIALLRPLVLLALGSTAAHTLLGTTQALGALRGKIHRYHGIPVVVTYHPAALLRNEAWKRPAWQDVQLARRIHDAARAASTS